MSTRFQRSYGEMQQKVEALEKELEESSNQKFHEIARKNQELQKLKQQISELEDYVKKVAKPPPPVTEYSRFLFRQKSSFPVRLSNILENRRSYHQFCQNQQQSLAKERRQWQLSPGISLSGKHRQKMIH